MNELHTRKKRTNVRRVHHKEGKKCVERNREAKNRESTLRTQLLVELSEELRVEVRHRLHLGPERKKRAAVQLITPLDEQSNVKEQALLRGGTLRRCPDRARDWLNKDVEQNVEIGDEFALGVDDFTHDVLALRFLRLWTGQLLCVAVAKLVEVCVRWRCQEKQSTPYGEGDGGRGGQGDTRE